MIGTADQPRTSRIRVDAVAVGQPEVEHQQVGLARAGLGQAVAQRRRPRAPASPRPPARRARSGGSAARPRSRWRWGWAWFRRRCRSARAGSGRFPARQRDGEFCPAAGRVGRRDRAAMRADDGLADRQAQPDARRRRLGLAARELLEHGLLAALERGRQAGAMVAHGEHAARARGARADARSAAAPYLAAFSSRLTSTRSISTASNSTSGRSAGSAVCTGMRAERGPRGADAPSPPPPPPTAIAPQVDGADGVPLSSRAMSSRLLTSAFSCARLRGDGLRDLALALCASGGGQRLQRIGQRDQRGQRRAHVVRDRAQQRVAQPLRFHLDHRLLRHLDVVHALQRDRDLRAPACRAAAPAPGSAASAAAPARAPARRARASAP